MTAVLYPIAETAEAALGAPLGRAAREREARGVAGEEVVFVTEQTGPGFATLDAALAGVSGPGRGSARRRTGHGSPRTAIAPCAR